MSRKNALFILNELFEDDNLPYQVTTKICQAIEELEECDKLEERVAKLEEQISAIKRPIADLRSLKYRK